MEVATMVNMGMIKTGKAPDKLSTVLGSCIGLTLYDRVKKVGMLAHIMLPESNEGNKETENFETAGKFADVALKNMLKQLSIQRMELKNLEAKIVGGSKMFEIKRKNEICNIGKRNEEAVKKILNDNHIKIAAEDTGGNIGRKITFSLETGKVEVSFTLNKSLNKII
ncbi:MAG TPA: chemotaxis protein CheD [bacterium]|nr:chemotaxis protein CheD [bacterium]